jgi:hypothetical protein
LNEANADITTTPVTRKGAAADIRHFIAVGGRW